jgi:branched-chain amino acid transport system ATP-binding protein/nonpolar-amino-acid-transporting ATPase
MLNVQSIRAGYGNLPILQDVSMYVADGESVAIVGPNGAGKTTLIRALCGLIPVTSGRIEKDGLDLTSRPARERPSQGLAVVLENRHLFGELTVRENLLLALRHGQKTRAARRRFEWAHVMALFPMLASRERQRTELLSGGQQQMVAIARSLLLQPDILIMDEPSTGLAPKVFKDIRAVFGTLHANGVALVLVEQNLRIAAEATKRAYVMAMGRIVDTLDGTEWKSAATSERLAGAYLGASRSPS